MSDEDILATHANVNSTRINHELGKVATCINNESCGINNEPSYKPVTTSQEPITPIEGSITQSRAKKLQQEVNSLLTEFGSNINNNFILPKCDTHVLLRFTHEGDAAGPKEMN